MSRSGLWGHFLQEHVWASAPDMFALSSFYFEHLIKPLRDAKTAASMFPKGRSSALVWLPQWSRPLLPPRQMTPMLGSSSLPLWVSLHLPSLGPGSALWPHWLTRYRFGRIAWCLYLLNPGPFSRWLLQLPWLGSGSGTLADQGCPPRAVRSWGQGGSENRAQQVTWTVSDTAWGWSALAHTAWKHHPTPSWALPWPCTPWLSSLILGISSWRLGSLLPGLVRPECESLGVLQGSLAWLLWLHLKIPSNLVRPLLDPDSYLWIGVITKAVIVLVIMLWELLPFLWPLEPTFQTPLSALEWPVLGLEATALPAWVWSGASWGWWQSQGSNGEAATAGILAMADPVQACPSLVARSCWPLFRVPWPLAL